ncbi:hypothetical protein JB92DRAFT_2837477, partial [Gautieria morchelliformis]
VTGLQPSTNNHAETVLELFLESIRKFGCPSSMHNSHIKRLWVEVGKQFVRQWRGFFLRLEPASAIKSKQSNPTDVFEDVHPDLLQHYHSVLGDPIHRGSQQTGAGYLSGEEELGLDVTTVSDGADPGSDIEESEQTTLEQAISSHISANVKHEAIKCPRHRCPFDDPTYVPLFDAALCDVQASGLIPAGYGLNMLEWDGGEYPASELIRFGQKKEIIVDLPLAIWMPWTLAWLGSWSVCHERI